jgi:uracil phosphoribosyltransferase
MRDKAHFQFTNNSCYLNHHLGENVYILDDIYTFSMLAKLSTPELKQPMINIYLRELYRVLLNSVISTCFPKKEMEFKTRMYDENGVFNASVIDPDTKVLICDIARAGMIPGQVCFDSLNLYLNPDNVVFDHIMASRDIEEEANSVNTVLAGLKIIPEFSDGYLLIPDPMGASGSSIKKVIDLYKTMHKNMKIIVMHLIVTPEYVKKISESHPDVIIMAIRYDRGLSNNDSLNSEIGEFPDGEKSLTKTKYILPGAGGLGEIINNNYI